MRNVLIALVALVALAWSGAAMAQCHSGYGYGGGYGGYSYGVRSYSSAPRFFAPRVTTCDEYGCETHSVPVFQSIRVRVGYDVYGLPIYGWRTVRVGGGY
jgi:hypothetical protein